MTKTERVEVRFDAEELTHLDELCKCFMADRSTMIRSLIEVSHKRVVSMRSKTSLKS